MVPDSSTIASQCLRWLEKCASVPARQRDWREAFWGASGTASGVKLPWHFFTNRRMMLRRGSRHLESGTTDETSRHTIARIGPTSPRQTTSTCTAGPLRTLKRKKGGGRRRGAPTD
jgi:hypothetical protein